jgi:hypothetical protein
MQSISYFYLGAAMLTEKQPVNLKTVAAKVGLAPCSVSAILNHTEAARAIPQTTKDRVYRAAAELNYRPNLWARSLRTKRTRMVAVIAPGLGRSVVARVVASAQKRLHQNGYMLVLITSDSDDANHLCSQFQQRGIEGVIAIDANVPPQLTLPVTSVNLPYGNSSPALAPESRAWQPEVGDSAAESIMRQIENPASIRRAHVDGMPAAYVEMRSMNLGLSSAAEGA